MLVRRVGMLSRRIRPRPVHWENGLADGRQWCRVPFGSAVFSRSHGTGACCDLHEHDGKCEEKEPAKREKKEKKQIWTSDCWKCGTYLDRVNFFCPGCNVIQEPSTIKEKQKATHFELLGFTRSFEIDASQLEKTYWDLQKKLHPDRYGNKTEKEQEFSLENSSAVNEAYSVLKNPLDRAIYLLELNGIDALSEGGKTEMDPFVLMRVMEAREELDECDNEQELQQMRERASKEVEEIVQELAPLFAENKLDEATRATVKLKYSVKLLEEIDQKINSMQ